MVPFIHLKLYLDIEAVSCLSCLAAWRKWTWVKTLKKIRLTFQVSMLYLQISPKMSVKLLLADEICFISSVITLQEHVVYG